jgi:hypothetical protein
MLRATLKLRNGEFCDRSSPIGVSMANITRKRAANLALITLALTSLIMIFACSDKGSDANKTNRAAKNASTEPAMPTKSATTTPDTAAPAAGRLRSIGTFESRLCKSLETVVQEARQLTPAGTKAALVISVASEFDPNQADMHRAFDQIDVIASVSCPAARTSLLEATKVSSLKDALR